MVTRDVELKLTWAWALGGGSVARAAADFKAFETAVSGGRGKEDEGKAGAETVRWSKLRFSAPLTRARGLGRSSSSPPSLFAGEELMRSSACAIVTSFIIANSQSSLASQHLGVGSASSKQRPYSRSCARAVWCRLNGPFLLRLVTVSGSLPGDQSSLGVSISSSAGDGHLLGRMGVSGLGICWERAGRAGEEEMRLMISFERFGGALLLDLRGDGE